MNLPGCPSPLRRAAGYEDAEPIFLLATARSHSTVSIAMLSCHPQIYGFPELHVFHAPMVRELLAMPPPGAAGPGEGFSLRYISEYERTGLWRVIAQLHEGVQDRGAVTRARLWLESRADWPTELLMDHFLALVFPSIGLEKSPRTISSKNSLERCLNAYPRARFIHLVRHPATTLASMHKHWGRMHSGLSDKALRRTCAYSWYQGNLRVAKALRMLPGDRWRRVKAECLLSNPDSVLPGILDWLGLAHTEEVISQMKHPASWPFTGLGYNGSLGGGDPVFLLNPELRPVPAPGPVEFDPAWEVSQREFEAVKALAAYLGY
jgi:hypothetical protein